MATEKPLILFVHAAFHRPIHYNAVLNSLRDKNFTVIAPELPSTGADPTLTYADDVDVLNSALEPLLDQGKEVVVVAHDFGALAASHCIEGESVSERAECGLGGGIRHYINVCGLSYPEMGRNIVGKREDFPLPDYYHVEVSYTCPREKRKHPTSAYLILKAGRLGASARHGETDVIQRPHVGPDPGDMA